MTLALAPDVSVTDTEDGGMVLLDGRTGRYWQLNPTGGLIVRLLLSEGSAPAAASRLRQRFPQEKDRIDGDVDGILRTLRDRRLVTS